MLHVEGEVGAEFADDDLPDAFGGDVEAADDGIVGEADRQLEPIERELARWIARTVAVPAVLAAAERQENHEQSPGRGAGRESKHG